MFYQDVYIGQITTIQLKSNHQIRQALFEVVAHIGLGRNFQGFQVQIFGDFLRHIIPYKIFSNAFPAKYIFDHIVVGFVDFIFHILIIGNQGSNDKGNLADRITLNFAGKTLPVSLGSAAGINASRNSDLTFHTF
jgi:hypothetical protein